MGEALESVALGSRNERQRLERVAGGNAHHDGLEEVYYAVVGLDVDVGEVDRDSRCRDDLCTIASHKRIKSPMHSETHSLCRKPIGGVTFGGVIAIMVDFVTKKSTIFWRDP